MHDPAYVAMVEALDSEGLLPGPTFSLNTPDNPVFPGHPPGRAGWWAVPSTGRDYLVGQEQVVLQLGGGLHHAQRARAEGFCLYNDLAVAIQAMVDHGWRVAYLDIDLHHGGTGCRTSSTKATGCGRPARIQPLPLPRHRPPARVGGGYARGLSINVPLEPLQRPQRTTWRPSRPWCPRPLSPTSPPRCWWSRGGPMPASTTHGRPGPRRPDLRDPLPADPRAGQGACPGRLLVTLGGGYEAHPQVVSQGLDHPRADPPGPPIAGSPASAGSNAGGPTWAPAPEHLHEPRAGPPPIPGRTCAIGPTTRTRSPACWRPLGAIGSEDDSKSLPGRPYPTPPPCGSGLSTAPMGAVIFVVHTRRFGVRGLLEQVASFGGWSAGRYRHSREGPLGEGKQTLPHRRQAARANQGQAFWSPRAPTRYARSLGPSGEVRTGRTLFPGRCS